MIVAAPGRALRAGTSLIRVLETVSRVRERVRAPLVLMTYYNPLYAFGLKAFARTAVDAGVDGVLVVDLPPEEATELAAEAEGVGLDLIHMVAPTSTPPRLRLIGRRSCGFVYVVSRTGVTGERADVPAELGAQLRALRLVTTKPICVGFGIAKPEQVAAVGALADGVIVGSAIVRAEGSVEEAMICRLFRARALPAPSVLGGGREERAVRLATTVGRGAKPPSES